MDSVDKQQLLDNQNEKYITIYTIKIYTSKIVSFVH